MMNEYVIGRANSHLRSQLTGKAANLLALQEKGLPVPEFICLTSKAYTETIAPVARNLCELLINCNYDDYEQLKQISTRAKALILSCKLSQTIQQKLQDELNTLSNYSRFSVRSSAALEDGASYSFAGQLATSLNVKPENIEQSIMACWQSAFEPGILTYLKQNDLDPLLNEVSVVIQRMVNADSSGVLFQADPRGGINQKIIVAGYGLGDGIVSDKVESDLYVWEKLANRWTLQVNPKTRRIVLADDGGTLEELLPTELQYRAVLNEAQRLELMNCSEIIATMYDHYQDIEWSFDEDNKLFILQSRPITTIPRGVKRAFDSSNIAESYPGCISPLTFSLLRRDYHHCVRGALDYFGVPAKLLEQRDYDLWHLTGYIHGRAYYFTNNWYRTFLLSPFFKADIIRYFDQMIGADGSYTSALDNQSVGLLHRFRIAMVFPFVFCKSIFFHDSLVARYFSKTQRLHKQFVATDLQQLSTDEIIGYLNDYTHQFLHLLKTPIINDFLTMVFMFTTRDLLKRVGFEDAEECLNQALVNQGLESAIPVKLQSELSTLVRDSESLKVCLQTLLQSDQHNSLEGVSSYLNAAGFADFADQCIAYISLYGHRSPKELILEADTFRENPYALIRLLVHSSAVSAVQSATDSGADVDLETRLSRSHWRTPLRWLLGKTRKAIAHREATRLDRGLHFAAFRTIVRELGQRMEADELIDNAEDVFLFSLQELNDYRMGCSMNADLKAFAKYRQSQQQLWLSKDPQEQLFTSGAVYGNSILEKSTARTASNNALKGTSCSGGLVTGHAVVVSDPDDVTDLHGKILVAESTDPGWVFLMTMSLGLVAERGSLLSHTAIIGRELNIPTVVGVKNATRMIKDGDLITLDGDSGQIYIEQ